MGRGALSSSELLSVGFAVSLCQDEGFGQISAWLPFSSTVVRQSESICCLHGAWTSWWLWAIWPNSKTNGDGPSECLPAGFVGLCFQGPAESKPPARVASVGALVAFYFACALNSSGAS